VTRVLFSFCIDFQFLFSLEVLLVLESYLLLGLSRSEFLSINEEFSVKVDQVG